MVVTNTGNVDLTNVSVVDNLPAGLIYTSTVSNTCGGAVNANGQPDHLRSVRPGGRRLVHDRAPRRPYGRVRGRAGEQRGRRGHLPVGLLQRRPAGDRQRPGRRDRSSAATSSARSTLPIPASARARRSRSAARSATTATCGAPARRPAASRSAPARTRWWSPRSPAAASSTNPCSVTIIEDPRPTCSIDAPDTRVCPGETVEICGPVGDVHVRVEHRRDDPLHHGRRRHVLAGDHRAR